MLVELLVENYAVVERLRVSFHPGLNLLTGETGSGKSIIVDALALLFGGRASTDMIRSGAASARVSGIFTLPEGGGAEQVLASAGLTLEDGELLIEREIATEGRSRAFVASRPVSVALLRDLSEALGDIHGQHDQQLLFVPERQREWLDAYAGAEPERAAVRDAYTAWRACQHDLEELENAERHKLQMLDLWSFQVKEIEQANPRPDEDTELEQERRVLKNLAQLEAAARAAYDALYEAAGSALSQIRAAARHMDELCRIDPSLESAAQQLAPAEIAVEETAFALRDYLTRLEADPGRLDDVETRLAVLDRLKRKYGGALAAVLEHLDRAREEISRVEHAEEHRARLQQRLETLRAAYEDAAAALSRQRAEAAARLEQQVVGELGALAMERSRLSIAIRPAEPSPEGSDQVRFLFSANLGEEPRPLEKVASGGELSRLALALKTCLTAAAQPAAANGASPRTLIFDEVDAGIGGKAAESVGRRLKQLAAANQVLCVTHQPQIASFADHHYYVEKVEEEGRTLAKLVELNAAERVQEIGRMISGNRITPEALKHAEQLIASSRLSPRPSGARPVRRG